jgi:hypothetical protein
VTGYGLDDHSWILNKGNKFFLELPNLEWIWGLPNHFIQRLHAFMVWWKGQIHHYFYQRQFVHVQCSCNPPILWFMTTAVYWFWSLIMKWRFLPSIHQLYLEFVRKFILQTGLFLLQKIHVLIVILYKRTRNIKRNIK